MQHLSGRWMKALNGIVIALSLALPGAAQARSLESLVNVQGVRENQLVGYSLVVGLDGTGDKNQVKFTNQTITNMLRQFGVQLPNKIDPKVKNVAAVAVSAMLPPMPMATPCAFARRVNMPSVYAPANPPPSRPASSIDTSNREWMS